MSRDTMHDRKRLLLGDPRQVIKEDKMTGDTVHDKQRHLLGST